VLGIEAVGAKFGRSARELGKAVTRRFADLRDGIRLPGIAMTSWQPS
jgi:hypothetical protein